MKKRIIISLVILIVISLSLNVWADGIVTDYERYFKDESQENPLAEFMYNDKPSEFFLDLNLDKYINILSKSGLGYLKMEHTVKLPTSNNLELTKKINIFKIYSLKHDNRFVLIPLTSELALLIEDYDKVTDGFWKTSITKVFDKGKLFYFSEENKNSKRVNSKYMKKQSNFQEYFKQEQETNSNDLFNDEDQWFSHDDKFSGYKDNLLDRKEYERLKDVALSREYYIEFPTLQEYAAIKSKNIYLLYRSKNKTKRIFWELTDNLVFTLHYKEFKDIEKQNNWLISSEELINKSRLFYLPE